MLVFLCLLLSFSFLIPDLHPTLFLAQFQHVHSLIPDFFIVIIPCVCHNLFWCLIMQCHGTIDWLNWHICHTSPVPSAQTNTRISLAYSWPFPSQRNPPTTWHLRSPSFPEHSPEVWLYWDWKEFKKSCWYSFVVAILLGARWSGGSFDWEKVRNRPVKSLYLFVQKVWERCGIYVNLANQLSHDIVWYGTIIGCGRHME